MPRLHRLAHKAPVMQASVEVRAQRGRNMTQLYMQLDATIDDVTATANY